MIEDAGFSAKDMRRPGVQEALKTLKAGDASALVVAKLDRLSRSMVDFAGVMAQAQKQGWALVALDCAVDTTTPAGEAMAHVLATFAHFERRLISQRTREALAVKKAQGVVLGRPRSMAPEVHERIRKMKAAGESLAEIARTLTTQRVPTAQGGLRWYPSTVRAVLHSERREQPPARAVAEKTRGGTGVKVFPLMVQWYRTGSSSTTGATARSPTSPAGTSTTPTSSTASSRRPGSSRSDVWSSR